MVCGGGGGGDQDGEDAKTKKADRNDEHMDRKLEILTQSIQGEFFFFNFNLQIHFSPFSIFPP